MNFRTLRLVATLRALPALTLFSIAVMAGCAPREPQPTAGRSTNPVTHHAANGHQEPDWLPAPCSSAWKRLVDQRLRISDSSGPAIGSAQWMEVVGRKSGVTDTAGHGPDPGSTEWCQAVDDKVFGRR